MKNKYLTKCLCITLVSGMIFAGPSAAFSAENTEYNEVLSEGDFIDQPGDGFVSEPPALPDMTPTPPEDPDVTPTPPENPDVTPTPPETPDATPTPPENPDVTPTPPETPDVTPTPPENPDATPTPPGEISVAVKEIIDKINKLALEEITLEHKEKIEEIRKAYDLLTDEEKLQVSNFRLFEDMEKIIKQLEYEVELPFEDNELPFLDRPEPIIPDGFTNTGVQVGRPVYFTNMVSNLHAGKDFYLGSLKKYYQITFSEDFPEVMDQIEKEYKEKNKLTDASDRKGGETSSADTLLVRNWQDILAVYIYEQSLQGVKNYTLDASCKDDLAKIFAEMNPVIRDKQNITKVTYGNYHINHYIKKNKIPKSKRKVLKKYVETDCKLLCATVTGAKGFVRQSVGDDVSEERVNVLTAAYSLVGKIGYFWGGKSTVIGEDANWGRAARVTASGSNSTGTLRAYGLDCSGFVTWAVVNGYKDKSMQAAIGDGTTDQWLQANVISEAEAQPGDLVFQRGPEAGSDNHVGILCGKTDAGDWIAVHCSASKNGVTVGEAYGASFRYIRQPSFYPGAKKKKENRAAVTDGIASGMTVNNSLQDIINSGERTFTGNKVHDFIGPEYVPGREISIFPDKIVLDSGDIEVFKAE